MAATQSPSLLELQSYLIPGLPSSVYYIPAFLPPATCDVLLDTILATPSPRWTNLSRRRLLSLPSPLTGKSRDTLVSSAPLPAYLTDEILPNFQTLGIFNYSPHGAPNHVLVNEYLPGQGIMPHEDGPAYHPVTATVSLGSSTVLDIYSKAGSESDGSERRHWRVLQEPGSLLVTMADSYTETLHGIAETWVDEDLREETVSNWGLLGSRDEFRQGCNSRNPRVSLTYRDVKKVVWVGGRAKNNILGNR
ncbi:hypothetical protein GJ744_008170 [Endocarpon pusillum]|uniref:Fe2OG dioxygenase domain-containing protein n=1 Tax=Endocarpon pusillum TaxID=364733 RepID=A0A8H7E728_9EURO|nr:hypothetical protein GJ744_008170 [Endocarpon pusillum]